MHWERQGGRYPRDPRLGHRVGISYVPTEAANSTLQDLYTTSDGFVSLSSSCATAVSQDKEIIIILGGSVAMGLGASSNEKTIASCLQRELNEIYPSRFCVLNAACAAYCSWQELIKFSLELSGLKPSFVFSISSWNDFVHSSVGDRYSSEWYTNHDRSIDDLSDLLLGLNERISMSRVVLDWASHTLIGSRLISLFVDLARNADITAQQMRWGYHYAKYTFRPSAPANYIHNMRQINAICNALGCHFKCILQPTINDTASDTVAVSDLYRQERLNPGFLRTRDLFYKSLDAIRDYEWIIDPPDIHPRHFADHCHLKDEAQSTMAQFISVLIAAR
jgi:hypothetical protein